MIDFDNDDLGISPLQDELTSVLTLRFGCEVWPVTLPSSSSSIWAPMYSMIGVFDRLIQAGRAKEGNLVILVFSGHGKLCGKIYSAVALLAANGDFSRNTLSWHNMTELLDSTGCDQIHLLICCHFGEVSSPNTEVFAATSATKATSRSLQTDITRALIDELKVANEPILLPSLYAEANYQQQESRVRSSASLCRPTLDADDVASFKRPLQKMVPNATTGLELAVEGVFHGDSSVDLITVPVQIWCYLRPTTKLNFVAHVKSGNELLRWAEGEG
ncbi:hypothetical protein K470DRAFT_265262 [Piedraia hortae CBS 480.64]|uniref:Uncharacterized protein n=1 Tax=Piedraia hortae CBS 480.64 TaxID=1314780 RepID=A0A6A7BVK9_9PEZI|nr:hypothetical protein K470DRAFT_265262 [Piedraia hortae CBS 480.64]